jgi:uncharacterized YccA/Bax inhibitor family protein
MPIQAQDRGSAGSAQSFNSLVKSFGSAPSATPFSASSVYDKVLALLLLATVSGCVAAVADLQSSMWMFVAMFAALGVIIWARYRPQLAKYLAPCFAILEGAVLGIVSRLWGQQSHGIVPIAIVGTAIVFAGVLGAYRLGIVKVSPKFVRLTRISSMVLLGSMLVLMFGGALTANIPEALVMAVFGFAYLGVAIACLFVDFDYVRKAEGRVSKDAEWSAALNLMIATVMVYLALLEILGGRRR